MNGALFVLALLVGSCASEPTLPRVPDNVAKRRDEITQVERTLIHANGKPRLVYQAQQWSDGRERRHGKEIEYDEAGTKIAERSFREGEPIGNWSCWWPNGKPRMELLYRGPEQPTTLSWWHENGQLATQGPARNALKDGLWSSWTEAGVLIEQGEYKAGRREGPWSFWRPDGSLLEEGTYTANRRTGTWIQYDLAGEPTERGAESAPARS
jgi:antitoxin component YwqK of YwqJK toxin-antitoxin module